MGAPIRILQTAKDVLRLRALCVVFVGGCVEDRAVAVEDARGGDGEFPALIAIDEGQVDEGAAVDGLLLVGDTIDEAELAGDLVAFVAEQRKVEAVLIRHEEGLLRCLRRDGGQRRAGLFDLGQDATHGFKLTAAEGVPAPAKEAEDEAAVGEQIGGGDGAVVLVEERELGSLCPGLQTVCGEALLL